ncbi:MAG TPA: acyl-CoA dehydrogenase family protein [Acidimicrobiia bacterium]|jgi:alkylation response protein AidB-like acyl-CoA dehydrogenase
MDVRLSPEQQALRDAAARVVDQLGPHTVAQLGDGERSKKLDAAVQAAGWRELRVEGDDGRPWASGVETAIVAEELGRGLADAAFVGPTLGAELRRLAGAPAATSSETVVLDASLTDLARTDSASDDLAGALAIDTAGSSDGLIGMPDGKIGKVPVEPSSADVDLTRPSARVISGAIAEPLAGAKRSLGADPHRKWIALGLALTCADLVGVMRGTVALATAYAAERRQYGVPVGSFQAVQHLLADALVATEGAASVMLHAAWAVDALAPVDALAAGSTAKAYCARAARAVCETSIQVHGGIGNTWECLAHVYLRRALLSIDAFGGVGPSLARVLEHHGIVGADGLR